MHNFTHSIHLVFAPAAFVHGTFNFFLGLAGAFLDATNQFIFLSFNKLEVVICKLRKFLFQLALGNVPVSFDGESAHIFLFVGCFCRATRRDANSCLQVACRPIEEIILPQNQIFIVSVKASAGKLTLKGVAICKPTPFIGLQIASFYDVSISIQLRQIQVLQ